MRVYRPATSTIPRMTSTRCVMPGLRAIRVVEDAFDDKTRHAELRHRRAAGAPKIMRRKSGDASACANPLAGTVLRPGHVAIAIHQMLLAIR